MQLHENDMQTLLDSLVEGVCVTDPADRIVAWNRALADETGVSARDAVGRTLAEFSEVVRWRAHESGGNTSLRFHFAQQDKNYIRFGAEAPEIGNPKDNVRASWQAVVDFFDQLPYIIFVLDEESRFLFANPSARQFLCGNEDDIIGRPFYDVLDERNDVSAFDAANRSVLDTQTAIVHQELSVFDHAGAARVLEITRFPASIRERPDETRRLLVCVAVDPGALRSAEHALLREKEQLAATLNGIGDGIVEVDGEGNILLMNAVAARFSELDAASAIGKPFSELFLIRHEHNRRPVADISTFMTSGREREERHNLLLEKTDGEVVRLAETLSAVVAEDGSVEGAVVVLRDVTEKRRTEEELRKAQKLESVATMAGGIAHDFNNILTAILGSITLVRMADQIDRDFYDTLIDAERAVREAKVLTQQLLVFAEGQAPVREDTPLEELVRGATDFALRGANVRASFEIATDLRPVRVDKAQIAQVIQNIVMNARDAMPDGGAISVQVSNSERTPPDRPGPPHPFIAISVVDHGIGIARQHMPRIFDPYFTTKPKSAGLGLSVCYSIVRNHDGFIDVSSQFGSGSRFSVYLPASDGAATVVSQETSHDPVYFDKRILVMDDERIVRDVLAKMFARLGCRCSFAEDGNEAIFLYARAQESGFPFDMVVLDLTVPGGMGGKETISRLKEIDPSVVAVVSSGYLNDPVIAEYRRHGFAATITKPYSYRDLAELLESVFRKA